MQCMEAVLVDALLDEFWLHIIAFYASKPLALPQSSVAFGMLQCDSSAVEACCCVHVTQLVQLQVRVYICC